jgi:hypothetical protein
MRWSLNSKLIDTIKRKMINLKIKKRLLWNKKGFYSKLRNEGFYVFLGSYGFCCVSVLVYLENIEFLKKIERIFHRL